MKNKPAKKKDSSLIWIVLVIGVAAFVLWRSQAGKKMAAQFEPVAQEQTPMDEPSIAAFDSSDDFKNHQEDMIKRRQAMLRLRASGMSKLTISKDQPYLKFETKAFARRCTPGDLDVIEHDLKFLGLKDDSLVFSLENLSSASRDFEPQSMPTSLPLLQANTKGQFEIYPPDRPMILGMFLCSYQGNLRSKRRICADLPPLSIAELINTQREALSDMGKMTSYPKRPKTYFFQMLVAGPNGVYIYNNKQTLDINLQRLRQALGIGSSTALENDLKRGVALMRSIESLPPAISGNQVTLMLPHRGDCPFVMPR